MGQYIQENGPMECAMAMAINCGQMDHGMKVSGIRIKQVVREDCNTQTVMSMKVTGLRTKHRAMELIHMHTVPYMKETG